MQISLLLMVSKKKVAGYFGLTSGIIGGFLLYEYLKSKQVSVSHITTTSTGSTTTTSISNTPTTSTTTSTTTSSVNCNEILSTDYGVCTLTQCFGVQLASCGYPSNLLSQNGFCEVGASGLNYTKTQPNVTGTIIFNNQTDAFFGYYWYYPNWAVIPHCYCNGSQLVYEGGNGTFVYMGEILPNGYSWLPSYEAPNVGSGFLTYQGAYWGSPGLTASAYQYAKQNNQTYTMNIQKTPDEMGYTLQTYNVSSNGSLCLYDPNFNSSLCFQLESPQTFPYWATSGTTVYFCPPNTTNYSQCQQVYP